MTSPNILLTRIDNRLVHGQVGVTWTSTIGANLGSDSNLLIVFYVQIMPDDLVMQLHR
ncbi:PTS sugar transporter subunit IIB, partial [Escherichia coli]|nr:PTS sugar transporter subunit IIB [Escherichia coli]MDA6387047.1 PTS sugar transporter subunit IIB [Escherichia coli]MDA6581663.1 PTS sugar transporter subunit IIB [Escherichia coli]MDA6739851.1 PTS sugar transporter subunit IIB [Escherichia coli]MDA6802371.1 PTS sugar transporter subunit IIB [Escherichia coli]